MDGATLEDRYTLERRKRLAAERTLERTRTELSRAYRALVANADRLSLRYLSEREANLRLTDRQRAILAQRKEAAEKADRARRRLWHALEAMRDGFALFDTNARLVAANSVYLGLFDVASEIGPGASAEELFRVAAEEGAFELDGEPDEWVEAQLARWKADRIGSQILRTYDGRTIRFQDHRAPDGDLVSLAIDLTEEQAREDSLAAARDAAEATARAKQAFLARMSHEMRTPMNGILGLSEMLVERDLDPEAQTFARTIRDSAEALLTIVGDTLDVSQLEAGRVEIREETFDLEALLIDCIRLSEAARKGRPVEVVLDYPLDAPARVAGDAGRIRQIVMNLLGNATKFTEAGHVLVRAVLSRVEGGVRVVIDVIDTGPGIPEGQRETIFEAFAQVDAGRPQAEGTGLGLTISRGLAERMGGTLIATDPEEGAGSRFRLSIPFRQAQDWPARPDLPALAVPPDTGVQGDVLARRLAAAGVSVARAREAAVAVVPFGEGAAPQLPEGVPTVALGPSDRVPESVGWRLDLPVAGAELLAALRAVQAGGPVEGDVRPRILIVDDNATNRFLLERMLSPQGYAMELAEDGSTAVAAYRNRRPDLVLMDISMPGMDGFEALAAIRALEEERGGTAAPVIALTAHSGAEIEARLGEAGFASHQKKPVRKAELLAAMADALGAGRG
ncbi:ATP-binding protein [Jannaschia formosa]|uniref:ATP-binding protein n=1 Tax=Jannaschia formosa TaxID=2259592 RepID=UPI000E1BB849|nr:ATP-binding protein [Jannaschia formosa]TFL18963.1 response regulator [Jannaschia formosa]